MVDLEPSVVGQYKNNLFFFTFLENGEELTLPNITMVCHQSPLEQRSTPFVSWSSFRQNKINFLVTMNARFCHDSVISVGVTNLEMAGSPAVQ